MTKTRSRGALVAMSMVLFIGAQFAMVNAAHAKAAKSTAAQVPGKPGVFGELFHEASMIHPASGRT